jgi:predicted ATPase
VIAIATERGYPHYRAQGTVYRGWAKVEKGDVTEGMSLLRGGSADYRAIGAKARLTFYLSLLVRACEIAGEIEEGLVVLEDALLLVEETGERWVEAELNRQKGQLLRRQGDAEAAEEFYRKAIGIAIDQEAKLWELRAATSLARLWGEQGKRTEAHELLSPVYRWFTEGFDTADLKEAKVLLDGLA